MTFAFNKALHTASPTALGVTLFSVSREALVSRTRVAAGELLASRWPDRTWLAEAVEMARQAGARGVAWFRLPDGSDASGWSLRQLGSLSESSPALTLCRAAGSKLALTNTAPADLPPRLSDGTGSLDRGYALELDAPAAIFREALSGEFWRVTAHADPDTRPAPTAVPLATRLTFWFSHLRAGESLSTGLIQLAPGAELRQVRYRILNCSGAREWRLIE